MAGPGFRREGDSLKEGSANLLFGILFFGKLRENEKKIGLFVTILQVKIECGTTNEIYAASEPNRCEYEFKYRTPAACASLPPPIQRDPLRDEL